MKSAMKSSVRYARARREDRLAHRGHTLHMDPFDWWIDEHLFLRGWVRISGTVRASTPAVRIHALRPDGRFLRRGSIESSSKEEDQFVSRFAVHFLEDEPVAARSTKLRVIFADGGAGIMPGATIGPALESDEYHRLKRDFFVSVAALGPGANVIDIGCGGVDLRSKLGGINYIGFDIRPGPHVTVEGDAHRLSRYFSPQSLDAAVSISAFEHFAMPWKVVIELNRVLRKDARVLVASHQTFPLHEEPEDYWRFSSASWRSLFNHDTGFELEAVAQGEPASIVAHMPHEVTLGLELQPAFIGCAAVARKTGPSLVDWTPFSLST